MADSWNDLFMRKALDDTGTVPYPGGCWTMSPDIIPNGPSLQPDPASAFGAATYGSDLGKPTSLSQSNYFYARAQNLNSEGGRGDLYMYYCPQHLFLFPSLWVDNQMKTDSGKDKVPLVASQGGDVAVTAEPFTCKPESSEHSCLIARLDTPLHPNPLPEDGSIATFDDLGKFICEHPNYAWRNVVLEDQDIPTFDREFELDTTSLAPGTVGKFLIGVSFSKLSVGSKLAFSTGTPIPSGPDQGKIIQLTETAVTQSDGSLGDRFVFLPAGYKTTVHYKYWAQTPVLTGWDVTYYAILITTGTQENALRALSRPITRMGIPGLNERHKLLKSTYEEGILLGDVTTWGR